MYAYKRCARATVGAKIESVAISMRHLLVTTVAASLILCVSPAHAQQAATQPSAVDAAPAGPQPTQSTQPTQPTQSTQGATTPSYPWGGPTTAGATATGENNTTTLGPMRVDPGLPPPEPRWVLPQRQFYGWQFLLMDAVALGLAAGAIPATDAAEGGLLAAAFTLGAFSGPIVHWAHGHGGRGFGSLGIRVGLTGVMMLIGLPIDAIRATSISGSGFGISVSSRPLDGGAMGVLGTIGFLTASIVDAAALAFDTIPPTQQTTRASQPVARRRPNVLWTPFASAHRNNTGMTLGVSGLF